MALKNTKPVTQAPSRQKPKQDQKILKQSLPPLSTQIRNLGNDIPNNVPHRPHRNHCTKPSPTPASSSLASNPMPARLEHLRGPFPFITYFIIWLASQSVPFHVCVLNMWVVDFNSMDRGCSRHPDVLFTQPTTGPLSNPHVTGQGCLPHI